MTSDCVLVVRLIAAHCRLLGQELFAKPHQPHLLRPILIYQIMVLFGQVDLVELHLGQVAAVAAVGRRGLVLWLLLDYLGLRAHLANEVRAGAGEAAARSVAGLDVRADSLRLSFGRRALGQFRLDDDDRTVTSSNRSSLQNTFAIRVRSEARSNLRRSAEILPQVLLLLLLSFPLGSLVVGQFQQDVRLTE